MIAICLLIGALVLAAVAAGVAFYLFNKALDRMD